MTGEITYRPCWCGEIATERCLDCGEMTCQEHLCDCICHCPCHDGNESEARECDRSPEHC